MSFLQSNWFMWVVMVIVFGGIAAAFLEGFENAGFDEGEVWGYTKRFLKLVFGYLIFPFVIWFKKD